MPSDSGTERAALRSASPVAVRQLIRDGRWVTHTSGCAEGFVQANLVILPAGLASEFRLFCERNRRPCPLIDVTAPGSPVPTVAAPDADLRTDIPRYRVYRDGVAVEEPASIEHLWRDDLVAFLLGCSYTFEFALDSAGVELWHLRAGRNVAMYRTSIDCVPAGRFSGPLVVSMRPIRVDQVTAAVEISGRYPTAHGAPVHIGDPREIGIADLGRPDWGDPAPVADDTIPVFWACGVTPQAIAIHTRPPLMITHSPGHMFVTDVPIAALERAAGSDRTDDQPE